MKKRFIAIILAVLTMVIFVSGCTKKDDTSSGSSSTDKKVELTVWESTEGPDEFIKQAGAKYTEKNPNVTIKFVNVELGDSTTKIALDGPASVGPDLFAAPHDKLGELVAGGHVLTTKDGSWPSSLLAACETALTYDGKKYGYPVSAETYALFYNKDLIKEADVPKTFEELKTFCENFNKAGKYGFMFDVGNGYYTILFTTSDNNRLFGPNGTDSANSNINSEASIKGMEFFKSLRSTLNVPAADLTTAICDGAFKAGDVAMYITGLWNAKSFTEEGIDFGVTTIPSLPGDSTPASSFAGTRAMFVSAYSKNTEEAAKFAEFLLTEEMQKLRFELTGSLPSIDVTVDSAHVQGLLKQLEYAFPMPSIPEMNQYWDAMNAASANIWDGADVKNELDACNSAMKG